MNEELQGALAEILNGVLSAKDFVLAELPEVIYQLLLWKFAESIICLLAGIAALAICCIGAKKTWEWAAEDGTGLEAITILWLLPTAFAVFEGLNIKWLQIWLAPKVYLIEYAASLAK